MGTKNNPGTFDCYKNAELDEPMFILLARDKYAPAVVNFWAELRENDNPNDVKVFEAFKCVKAMIAWRAVNRKKD